MRAVIECQQCAVFIFGCDDLNVICLVAVVKRRWGATPSFGDGTIAANCLPDSPFVARAEMRLPSEARHECRAAADRSIEQITVMDGFGEHVSAAKLGSASPIARDVGAMFGMKMSLASSVKTRSACTQDKACSNKAACIFELI